jgi:hypothetical protein|nr:MAG TPA: hypothetical protein [Podoviridae sp. ctY3D12]
MSPSLYLTINLDEVYKRHALTVPVLTTPDRCIPFMLNGREYCTGKMNFGKAWYAFLRDETSDGAIMRGLPNSIEMQIKHPSIRTIVDWITDKLFEPMITNAEFAQSKTELVRLRIAVNMINSLSYLSHNDKILWTNWVRELYWERKKILHEWYLQYILPF